MINSLINNIFNDEFLLVMLRIFVALTLAGIIGYEREIKNSSAGFRTHILVGVGSCLMMLLSLYGFEQYIERYDNIRFDPARIPSYVISGIGFLGAGTIIVNGMTIRGLTTAASIWAVAGLGLVVGAGMYSEAVLTTVVILLSLVFLNNIEKRFMREKSNLTLQVLIGPKLSIEELLYVIKEFKVKIKKVEIKKVDDEDRSVLIHLENIRENDKYKIYDHIFNKEDVKQLNEKK